MFIPAQMALMPDGKRLHLHHGPIDLIIEAFGTSNEVRKSYQQAMEYFPSILPGLVSEIIWYVLSRPARTLAALRSRIAGSWSDLKIIYDEKTPNYPYQVIMFPIYIGWSFFGVPYSISEREIDLELTLYDINKRKIKSYTGSFRKILPLNIYNAKVMNIINQLEISKIIIEDLKEQLMKDVEFLNQELKASYAKPE